MGTASPDKIARIMTVSMSSISVNPRDPPRRRFAILHFSALRSRVKTPPSLPFLLRLRYNVAFNTGEDTALNYRKLGRTGFAVSDIAHGLWGMGGWSASDDHESLDALQLAADQGCNFYDSAWAYGDGKSDGLLGQIIANNPDKCLYAASKVPPMNGKWPASPKYKYPDVFPSTHVFQYANKIRRKLGTETIDLLQLHVWDDSWAIEPEFRSTVEKLKGEGIIRSFGLSLNR